MSNRRSEHSVDQTGCFMDAYERLMEQFADGGRLDWPTVLNRFEGALLPIFDADGISILIGSPEPMTAEQNAFLRAYTSGRLASNPQGAAIPFQQAPWLESALESKTPLNVKDWAEHIKPPRTLFDRELSAVGARSALAAPFGSPGGLVGAAALYRTKSDAFSEEHERLIDKLSPLIQTILSSAYDYNEHRLGMLRTEIIHEVNAEAVAQLTSPEQLYDRVCELIHQQFELYDVAIFQVDWSAGDAGEMSLAGHSGEYFEYRETNYTQSVDIGNLGYAARTGQTRLVNDAQNDPVYFNAFPDNQTIRSELTIPIKTEGEYVTAVMDVQSQESYAFDKYQVASLEALSRLVASIVQSVDWYKQMEMLHRLGQQLQHTLDLKSLYHAILTCVTAGPGFGFNRAILFMLDEENAALEEKLYIGPASTEEAYRIWSEIGEQTIEEYLDQAPQQVSSQEVSVEDRFMRVPVDSGDVAELSELGGAVAATRDGKASCSVVQAFQQILQAEEFALIPLIARRLLIGVIIADNSITGQPISLGLLETLGAFASQAALALSNAQTFRRLEVAFEELESAKDQAHRHERQAIVGQLMQYVTHEIRNPLVSIGGFARRILKTTQEEETTRRAGVIAQETSRLEIILKDVMDFMSPLSLEYESISVEALAKEMTGMIAESAAESNVRIAYECPEPVPNAHLDVDRMKQTLWNLSKNAVEAMPNGGVLTIRLGVEGDYVCIEIEDTGTGIQSDHIDRLFEPFYTTKKYGSGLGLALTKQIIDHHGGSIEARSELNHGTAFTIRLPINRSERKDVI